MICQLPIIFFFCPFSILQYKSLSYREVCAIRVVRALKALRADRAPRGFQLHKEVPSPQCSKTGELLELLKLRFVSLSSETSRSFGTTQSSQSSIGSHPVFPDADSTKCGLPTCPHAYLSNNKIANVFDPLF